MYMKRTCNCGCNNMQNTACDNEQSNMYQAACSDVENYNNIYDDCDCGFDEPNNFFPENPMLAQSYVPVQTMDKVFTPSVRIKNGNYFPRTCKSLHARTKSRGNKLY